MAEKTVKTVLGIELTESLIIISEVGITAKQKPVLHAFRVLTTPSRTVSNTELISPEVLADQIGRALKDMNIKTKEAVVSINHDRFLKHLDKFPSLSFDDLSQEIDQKIRNSYIFLNEDFDFGFQYPPEQDDHKLIPVLYAALGSSSIDSIKSLCDILELNLVGIDLVPLAIVRLLAAHTETPYFLAISLEENWIDFTIVNDSNVLFTHTLRVPASVSLNPEVGLTSTFEHLDFFMMSFFNAYPTFHKPEEIIVFSRLDIVQKFFPVLETKFPDIPCSIFDLRQVMNLENASPDGRLTETSHVLVPSIGLAYKFFEKPGKTLNLISIKKQFNPIINRRQLSMTLLGLGALTSINVGGYFYLSYALKQLEFTISRTHQSLQTLQTGEFLSRRQELDLLNRKILFYDQLSENKYPKAQLLQDISSTLPNDLYFENFSYEDPKKISLKGAAASQRSIYAMVSQLKGAYKNVMVSSILTDYAQRLPVHKFEVQFSLEP
jgi:hypothetical protein